MAKYSWSEIFTSIEGEGPYSGWPTIYVRFTGCNFECRGFNNPEGLDTTSVDVLGFNPKDYSDIYTIPLITKGCDSIYSWDPKFRHMWTEGDENKLAEAIVDTLPHHSWYNPVTGHPIILSLTGGEPTLRAKTLPTLLNHPLLENLTHLLIETNCSVPLSSTFLQGLDEWLWAKHYHRKLIWSNSPKLSVSGEPWKKAIRPDIALSQISGWDNRSRVHIEQYFKFVCGPNEEDFDEVKRAMDEYHSVGCDHNVRVYIMPTACLEEQQQEIAAKVAGLCIDRGYIYCHRIQNSVFGNGVGT